MGKDDDEFTPVSLLPYLRRNTLEVRSQRVTSVNLQGQVSEYSVLGASAGVRSQAAQELTGTEPTQLSEVAPLGGVNYLDTRAR